MQNGACLRLSFAAAMAGLTHCAAPIDTPSGFSGERYLCGPEHAAEFDALVRECRAAQQTVCNGVLSLRGTIDSEEVTLDTWVASAAPEDWGGDQSIARTVSLLAASPYFNIKLDMMYLAVPPLTSVSGEMPENCSSVPARGSVPCMLLNLEARGGNYLSGVLDVARTIEVEAPPELRTRFSGELARGGQIDGCFHVFVREPR